MPSTPRVDAFFDEAASGARSPVPEASGEARLGRVFVVVDALTGAPIDFVARCASGSVDVTLSTDGRLVVAASAGEWDRGLEIALAAPSYDAASVRLTASSPERIELSASLRTTIHVTEAGRVVPIRRCTAGFVESWRARWIDPSHVKLLEDGGVSLRHARPLSLHVYGPEEELLFSGLVHPGSDRWIERDPARTQARLTRLDGTPAAGIEVVALSGGGPSEGVQVTDRAGRFLLPPAGGVPVRVELGSNRWRFAPSAEQPPGVRRIETGVALDVTAHVAGTDSEVRVVPATNRVRFLDRGTDRPVAGKVWLLERHVHEKLPEPVWAVVFQEELEDGWLEVPHGFSFRESKPSEPRDGPQAIASIAGYAPLELPREASPLAATPRDDAVYHVDALAEPSRLVVQHLGARVDSGTLLVRSSATGDVLFVGDASRALTYGPFERDGASVRVPRVHGRDHRGGTVWFVEPLGVASAQSDGEYVLELGQELGALRVEAEGELPPLCCRGRSGLLVRPTVHDGTLVLFDRLPPGRYVVGPEAWLRQASGPGVEPPSYEVRAGEITLVPFDADWKLEDGVTGRLILHAGVPRPTLLASFVTPVSSLVSSTAVSPVWPGSDGTYEIPPGGPVPHALVAVEHWGGTSRVRAVLPVGGTFVLDESLVVIEAGAGAPETLDVSYTYGPAWTDVPIRDELRDVDFRVVVGRRPVTIPVHRSVTSIRLRRLRDGMVREVQMSHTGPRRIDLARLFERSDAEGTPPGD